MAVGLGRGAVASESLLVDGVELIEGGSVDLVGEVDEDCLLHVFGDRSQ